MRNLGPDIKALIHHIQLNETGWIDRATSRAIKFLLWLHGDSMSTREMIEHQTDVALVNLTSDSLTPIIKMLREDGQIIETAENCYKLSEAERESLDDDVTNAESTTERLKNKIVKAAYDGEEHNFNDEKERLWNNFHEAFIVPFIQESGAKSYELVTGQYTAPQHNLFIADFVKRFPEEEAEAYKRMIDALLDNKDADCRTYILRLLNNYFFQSASRLSNETIENVFGKNLSGIQLRFLLDTNFLFSLLKLHANPSNESVSNLIGAIKKLPENINIGLYVLPQTIDEFKNALANYEYTAKNIRVTKNIVEAGIRSNVSGIIETYLERCKASNYIITPEDYFSPYHENLIAILKENGVEILPLASDKYSEDQRVIDDALDRLSFYKTKYIGEPRKQKSYEQVWHDVVFWYVINDRRPNVCESFFDADWIGVTIDYSLIGFDARQRKRRGVPCMAHPASLVQALQILIPIDEELEKVLISLIQMPVLFGGFDTEDEQATRKILGTLSRYENIDDLSSDSILGLLQDRALKGKISKTEDQNVELTLVKEAVIEHAALMEKDREEAVNTLAKAQTEHQQEVEIRKKKEAELNAAIESEIAARVLRQDQVEELEGYIDNVEAENTSLTQANILERQKLNLVVTILVALIPAIFFPALVWFYLPDTLMNSIGIVTTIVAVGFPLPLIIRGIRIFSRRFDRALKESGIGRMILKLDRWFWQVYGLAIGSIFASYLFENVKGAIL